MPFNKKETKKLNLITLMNYSSLPIKTKEKFQLTEESFITLRIQYRIFKFIKDNEKISKIVLFDKITNYLEISNKDLKEIKDGYMKFQNIFYHSKIITRKFLTTSENTKNDNCQMTLKFILN
jgi:hypothetical protein